MDYAPQLNICSKCANIRYPAKYHVHFVFDVGNTDVVREYSVDGGEYQAAVNTVDVPWSSQIKMRTTLTNFSELTQDFGCQMVFDTMPTNLGAGSQAKLDANCTDAEGQVIVNALETMSTLHGIDYHFDATGIVAQTFDLAGVSSASYEWVQHSSFGSEGSFSSLVLETIING